MNASFVYISIILASKIEIPILISFLNKVSCKALLGYLQFSSIYDGNANKKMSDLIEMIIYGYINNTLKNKVIDDISYNKAVKLLKEKCINVKGLPGYGNIDMKKADIMKKYAKK